MLGGHRAVEKGVGRFLLGVCSANRDLVGGSAAFRALQLRDTAVGNYFILAINKIILRRTRWGKSNWGRIGGASLMLFPHPLLWMIKQ